MVDFREGVLGDDIYGLESARERAFGAVGEGCEEEDEEDEAVFATIVGEGYFFEAILRERDVSLLALATPLPLDFCAPSCL